MNPSLVIGIAGGSGSGKTTLAETLAAQYPEKVLLLSHDNYYREHHALSMEERRLLNFDHPDAFDQQRFVDDLRQLKNRKTVESPVYDFSIHDRSNRTVRMEPKDVVIVEGILIFSDPELCELMDIKVFVDVDDDERLARRIRRDMRDRDRTLEDITEQYLSTVKPMFENYVRPSKKRADIIVPRGGKNAAATELLSHLIRDALEGRLDRDTLKQR